MMLAVWGAVLCVVVTVLLAWIWRRDSRRRGATVARGPAWAFALAVVALGGALYALVGYQNSTGDWLSERQRLRPVALKIIAGQSPGEVVGEDTRVGPLARVLQRELARHPDSVPGWYALGLLYHRMQQPRMAVKAARKALAVADNAGQRTAVRLLVARGLIAASGGELVPEAQEILLDIVNRQPRHDGAWTLLALSASRSGRHELAERAFQSLLQRHGEGELGAMLRKGLERARSARSKDGAASRSSGASANAAPVTVRVRAAEGVVPGGTLFVFLRRGGGAGKPLAARRLSVDEFPVTVTVRRGDWLQRPPADLAGLRAGARYSPGGGAGVGSAGLRVEPVSVDGDGEGPDAELRLEP